MYHDWAKLCNGRAQIGCSRAGSVCVVYGAGDGAGDGGGESRTRDDESSGWESGHVHCLKWGIGLSERRRSCGRIHIYWPSLTLSSLLKTLNATCTGVHCRYFWGG